MCGACDQRKEAWTSSGTALGPASSSAAVPAASVDALAGTETVTAAVWLGLAAGRSDVPSPARGLGLGAA